MTDEAAWVFVGILIGIPAGLVLGWIAAQIALPRSSTVIVERTETGYLIVER